MYETDIVKMPWGSTFSGCQWQKYFSLQRTPITLPIMSDLPAPIWIPSIHPAARTLPPLLLKMMLSTGQGGLTQWKSGSAATCKLIGCPDTKQTGRDPEAQGLEVGLYACWIVLPQYRRPCTFPSIPRRTQTDQQWLQINPVPDSHSDDRGPSASVLPQWLFLKLRTKCTTLQMTCRGMHMYLILTPI